MNLTRLNFTECFPHLISAIQKANFIACDLEMSGIISTPQSDPSPHDSTEIRYLKYKSKIEKFIPLQLGLCTARLEGNKIVYSPFNIYIYPLSLSERDIEQFTFNSESMRFLAANNFDFNKLFYEGVPFINAAKLSRNQIRLETIKEREIAIKQNLLDSPDVKAFLNLQLNRIVQWIEGNRKAQESLPKEVQGKQNQDQTNPEEEDQNNLQKSILVKIEYIKIKAYMVLIDILKEKYPGKQIKIQFVDGSENVLGEKEYLQRKFMKITYFSKQAGQSIQSGNQKQQKEEVSGEDSQQSISFNKVLEEIEKRKTPLIVHNGYLDLMHIYHRFLDELPDSNQLYKANLRSKFPFIFDTKYICNTNPKIYDALDRDTSLGKCYHFLRKLQKEASKEEQFPFSSVIDEKCGGYTFDDENSHEAGFDALMTCYTFVNSLKHLGKPYTALIGEYFLTKVQEHRSLLNRIPLGSMKIPFNLEQKGDIYTQMGTEKYQFKLLAKGFSGEKISIWDPSIERDIERWGATKMSRKGKDSLDFTLSFLNQAEEKRFQSKFMDEDGYGLYKLGGNKYLIRKISFSEMQGDQEKK